MIQTLSFALGIAFVMVIAIAIVAVYALVKANKLEKVIEEKSRSDQNNFDAVFRNISNVEDAIYRRMTDGEQSICRELDSRLDKLENKLKSTK